MDNMIISSSENIEVAIKSCHLFVKEVELYENDHIKYLKMLNDGYTKNINNVQNCDSVYMYGILNTNKEGLKYDLPSVRFIKPYLILNLKTL